MLTPSPPSSFKGHGYDYEYSTHITFILSQSSIPFLIVQLHYGDIIMSAIEPQITSLMIVYSTVYSDADQRKHQSSTSLAFVWGIHRGPVNSPHKWPVRRKMFPFGDAIMISKFVFENPRSRSWV